MSSLTPHTLSRIRTNLSRNYIELLRERNRVSPLIHSHLLDKICSQLKDIDYLLSEAITLSLSLPEDAPTNASTVGKPPPGEVKYAIDPSVQLSKKYDVIPSETSPSTPTLSPSTTIGSENSVKECHEESDGSATQGWIQSTSPYFEECDKPDSIP